MTIRYERDYCLILLRRLCLSASLSLAGIVHAGSVPRAAVPGGLHDPSASSPGRHVYSRPGAVFEVPDAPPVETGNETDSTTRVNINTASPEELAAALPGIGPGKAQRIVEWRENNGAFQSVEQLLEVSGIGPKTLENIRPFVLIADADSKSRHQRHQSREQHAVTLALGRIIRRAERDRSEAVQQADLSE